MENFITKKGLLQAGESGGSGEAPEDPFAGLTPA